MQQYPVIVNLPHNNEFMLIPMETVKSAWQKLVCGCITGCSLLIVVWICLFMLSDKQMFRSISCWLLQSLHTDIKRMEYLLYYMVYMSCFVSGLGQMIEMWMYELYVYVMSGSWQRSSRRSKAAQQFGPSLSESEQIWRGKSK